MSQKANHYVLKCSRPQAVNKLNGLVLDGRILYAGPAMTRTQRQRDFKHYDNDPHRYVRYSYRPKKFFFFFFQVFFFIPFKEYRILVYMLGVQACWNTIWY